MAVAEKQKSKPTTVRLDEGLKRQAVDICESMGMSYNTYVVMATRQLVNQRRIPFEVVATPAVLTEQTRRAMVAAEAKALGLIPDDSPSFSDVDSVMAYLDVE